MVKGFTSDGVDFDDLFDPDIQGDGPSTSWLTSAGVPLKYAAIGYGSKRADVGYRDANGVDVSNLWAAKGSAVYLTIVTARHTSQSGANTNANIGIRVTTTGTIQLNANPGVDPAIRYAPDGSGAASPYTFRIFGTVTGQRNATGATAVLTGKGGINYTPPSPGTGEAVNIDTGFQAADDAADFLTANCTSSGNNGEGSLSGSLTIQVKRVSDGDIVRTFSVNYYCQADSQT